MTGATGLRPGDLRALVSEISATIDSPDPRILADAVVSRMPADQLKSALRLCLPDWIRTQVLRPGARSKLPRSGAPTSADRVRAWYANLLASALPIAGKYKFLRDCTIEDLHVAAAERYRQATETHAEGDRWTKLALFMEEHDRETVAQVTEDELKSLMEES